MKALNSPILEQLVPSSHRVECSNSFQPLYSVKGSFSNTLWKRLVMPAETITIRMLKPEWCKQKQPVQTPYCLSPSFLITVSLSYFHSITLPVTKPHGVKLIDSLSCVFLSTYLFHLCSRWQSFTANIFDHIVLNLHLPDRSFCKGDFAVFLFKSEDPFPPFGRSTGSALTLKKYRAPFFKVYQLGQSRFSFCLLRTNLLKSMRRI